MNIQLKKVAFDHSDAPAPRRHADFPARESAHCQLPVRRRFSTLVAAISLMTLGSLWFSAPAAFAADEICASCGQQVSVSGDFAHRKDNASVAIEGAADNAAAFREEINGKNFTVTIAHLPAGKYTIAIGEVETLVSAPGERLFDVTSGDIALAKEFRHFRHRRRRAKSVVTSPARSSMRTIRSKGR